jgi:Tfp pilus assembly PilM family ATPase
MLAFDWENRQLCGVEADVTKGRVRVKRCFALERPDGLDAPQTGEWLKQQLESLSATSRQAVLVLPREDAVVRHVELPEAPDDEIPNLVRFQAAAKSSRPLDQLALDFLPLPRRADDTGRSVLMATISAELLATLRTAFTAADLELAGISISSTATTELIARVEPDADENAACLVVAQYGHRVEISVVHRRSLVFTHSTRLTRYGSTDEENQAIVAEVSRTFVALQKQHVDVKVNRAWVVGTNPENASLIQSLIQRLACPVGTVDPLAVGEVELRTSDIPGNRALYAGPIGMLLAQSQPLVESLDFLNPRRPVVKADRRKITLAAATAAVVLLVAALYGFRFTSLRALDREIADLNQRAKDFDERLQRVDGDVKSVDALSEWHVRGSNWLDQTKRLADTFQGTQRHYLQSLRFEEGSGNFLGTVNGDGAAVTDDDVYALYGALGAHKEWDVLPHEIPKTSPDGAYPYRLRLNLNVRHAGLGASAETQGAKPHR